ncbi:hypothetical protein V5P93_003192 [Actinokineospora auranticolor]|uniref:hypothetical protein n=1 Tax=Actinokineospora auranticolor TaxID=155976 RepID=UPI000CEC0F50|nr:hypothetical protein [Actinokineospora auranticolor]
MRLESCRRSNAEADAALGFKAPANAFGTNGILVCSDGLLCLFEHVNGGGRRLLFSDEYWHNLSTWTFDEQTSSWFTMQDGPPLCTSAADPGDLQDWQYYSITLSACSGQNSMGAWNDRATKVHG